MKKSLTFCLVLTLIIQPFVFAGELVTTYEFTKPIIERSGTYAIVYFKDAKLLGEPGKATLPFYPVKLLLPPGEIAVSISLKYENPVTVEGEFTLLPYQGTRPLSDQNRNTWLIDQDFYLSAAAYPSSFKPHIETQFYNGCGIALSAFTPVKYYPSKKKITYYQRVIVTIATSPDPNTQSHLQLFFPSEKKAHQLKGFIQNPESVTHYFTGRDLRTNEYDYLIITTDQFQSEFDTLVKFYKPRGIRSKITSLEYINSTTTGADIQEKIRNFIIAEYQSFGIEYVLLGGDVEIINYRGFYCYVISGGGEESYDIPADLYYSALDGNWNTDGDSRWGEPDEDDLYPEVGIGRLTFSNSEELDNMLHKVMLYQENPVEGELTSPLLAGEYLYPTPPTYGSDYMRLLVGYRTDNGYTTHGIPPDHPRDTLYDVPGYSWTKAELISHINAGHPWVHHTGHANYTYAMRMYNADITNANFSQVNGIAHNYNIVYTHGCNCGGFDQADCIAEKMIGIDNFAVAFVGNSRYGWFNQGTTDGPSEHLHREFLDALYYDSLYHIGMTHLKSKSETAPFVDLAGEFEYGATRWCFYDNNVLGDPMMALWTREPYPVEASYPELIPIGAGSVSVQITGPQGICKNFTCSIYQNDSLYGVANTDATGSALIDFEYEPAEGPISLVVSGYNILPQYFDIHVSDYWLGFSNVWNDPGNWFTGDVPDNSTYIIIPADPEGSFFPEKNDGNLRQCKGIYVEPSAEIYVGYGETFTIGSD
jgi:hypothetical protein